MTLGLQLFQASVGVKWNAWSLKLQSHHVAQLKLNVPNVKWNVHDVTSNDDTFEDLDILVANQLEII